MAVPPPPPPPPKKKWVTTTVHYQNTCNRLAKQGQVLQQGAQKCGRIFSHSFVQI